MEDQEKIIVTLKAELYDLHKAHATAINTIEAIARKLECQDIVSLMAKLDQLLNEE